MASWRCLPPECVGRHRKKKEEKKGGREREKGICCRLHSARQQKVFRFAFEKKLDLSVWSWGFKSHKDVSRYMQCRKRRGFKSAVIFFRVWAKGKGWGIELNVDAVFTYSQSFEYGKPMVTTFGCVQLFGTECSRVFSSSSVNHPSFLIGCGWVDYHTTPSCIHILNGP